MQVISDMGPNTIGNPCPVQDRKTGRILLPLTFNLGNVTEKQMIDRAVEARRTVFSATATMMGSGGARLGRLRSRRGGRIGRGMRRVRGNGIQTKKGRIVIPCDHVEEGTKEKYSHVIYSDDGGETWRIGGRAGAGTNECAVVELRDGSLLLNMRSYHGKNRRAVAVSVDGGLTWARRDGMRRWWSRCARRV
ncbi:MAG: exo-alpha-sialidase [Bryobacterales bacterium]|nr:exo-alpha-sialidase [Bryobacterales bacterium]